MVFERYHRQVPRKARQHEQRFRRVLARAAADQITNKVEGDRRLDDQIRYLRDARRAVESGRVRTSGVNATNVPVQLTTGSTSGAAEVGPDREAPVDRIAAR